MVLTPSHLGGESKFEAFTGSQCITLTPCKPPFATMALLISAALQISCWSLDVTIYGSWRSQGHYRLEGQRSPSIVPRNELSGTVQSLANMSMLGNSVRHVTSKVHARNLPPLQRVKVWSDARSELLNFRLQCFAKAKIPRDQYFWDTTFLWKKQGKLEKGVVAHCNER